MHRCLHGVLEALQALPAGLNFLSNMRSSAVVEDPAPWHSRTGAWAVYSSWPGQKNATNAPRDLTRGFYTEGEVGPLKVTEHISFMTTFLGWSLLTDTGNLCSKGQACESRSGAIDIIATGAHFLSNSCDFSI